MSRDQKVSKTTFKMATNEEVFSGEKLDLLLDLLDEQLFDEEFEPQIEQETNEVHKLL